MDRKQFLSRSLQVAAGSLILGRTLLQASSCSAAEKTSATGAPAPALPTGAGLSFSQLALPYAYSALEPSIDALTMEIHYTKHHAAYVKNVNDSIAAESITAGDELAFFAGVSKLSAKARNNGGGAWNHNLYWKVMKPNGGGEPTGKLLDAINGAFEALASLGISTPGHRARYQSDSTSVRISAFTSQPLSTNRTASQSSSSGWLGHSAC